MSDPGPQPPAGGFSPVLESALRAAAPKDFLPGIEEMQEGAGLLELDNPATVKAYTAARLEADTAKRDGIIEALCQGIGLHRIAKAYRVSVHTVIALRDRLPPHVVATEKKRLANIFRGAARICAERYIEYVELGAVKPENLPIGAGIFIERAADLDGSSPAGLEHSRPKITAADFNAYIETLPRAAPVSTGGKQDKGAAEPVCIELEPAAGAAQVELEPDPARRDGASPVFTGQDPDLVPDLVPPVDKSAAEATLTAGQLGNGPAPDRAPADHERDARAAGNSMGGGGGRAHAGAVRDLPVGRPKNF